MLNKITSIKMLVISVLFLSQSTEATCFDNKPDLFKTLPQESKDRFNQRKKALDVDVQEAEFLIKHVTSLSEEYKKCVNDRRKRLSTTAEVNPEQFAESDLIVAQCHRRFAEAASDLATQASALAKIEELDKDKKLQHSALVAGIEKLKAQDAAKAEAESKAKAADVKAVTDAEAESKAKAAGVKAVTDNEEAAANK